MPCTFGVGRKLTVASAPPPQDDFGDSGTSVALALDGGILVGSIADTETPGLQLIGLAKLVGDTVFDHGFELD